MRRGHRLIKPALAARFFGNVNLQFVDQRDDFLVNGRDHHLKRFKRFALININRFAQTLMVSAQADTRAEFFHLSQVVAPVAVDSGEDSVTLELAHDIFAVGFFLPGVKMHHCPENIGFEFLRRQLGDILILELEIEQVDIAKIVSQRL